MPHLFRICASLFLLLLHFRMEIVSAANVTYEYKYHENFEGNLKSFQNMSFKSMRSQHNTTRQSPVKKSKLLKVQNAVKA